MANKRFIFLIVSAIVIIGWLSPLTMSASVDSRDKRDLAFYIPEGKEWSLVQDEETYLPESLFEYINGAAEAYLSYGFEKLIVAELGRDTGNGSVLIEIYDMGTLENAFGIYGAERYLDNRFISIGTQGYVDEDSLNFLVGPFYVKLLCFGCEDQAENILIFMAEEITAKVSDPGNLPPLLDAFPDDGRVANSEKFVLKNVLGYSFLERGYFADFEKDGLSFSCFILDAGNVDKAEKMLNQYLEKKSQFEGLKGEKGFHIIDRYYANIFIARATSFVCGVMKIPDGAEELGKNTLKKLMQNLEKAGD